MCKNFGESNRDIENRMIEEKEKLDEKIKRLDSFMWSAKFESLDATEQDLMKSQYHYMKQYSSVLGLRIEFYE